MEEEDDGRIRGRSRGNKTFLRGIDEGGERRRRRGGEGREGEEEEGKEVGTW